MNKNKQYPYYHDEKIYTLREFLDFCEKKYSKRICFSYKRRDEVVNKTYAEFKKDVISLANYLLNNNFTSQNIALLGENSYEWIVSYFAIINSGNTVVPIDKDLDIKEIMRILSITQTKLVVYSNTYLDYAQEIEKNNIKLLSMKHIENSILSSNNKLPKDKYKKIKVVGDDIAAIIYTSGTTGVPKGVMLSNKNICINVTSGMQSLKFEGSTILSLPLHHTYGISSSVLCTMFWGCKIFINSSLKNLLSDFAEQKPDFMNTVPLLVETFYKNIYKKIREQKKEKIVNIMIIISNLLLNIGIDVRKKLFSSIRNALGGNLNMLVCGGAPLDKKYQVGFKNFGIDIIEGYGITECAPFIAVNRNEYYRFGSAGLPLTCSNVKIDTNGYENGEGEILVKGDMVMKGYYENPDLTEQAMEGDYFRTGDVGYMDRDNFIFITGRKKNIIILANGKNVYPEELEFKLLDNEEISEVIVKEKDNQIVAEIFPNYDFIKQKSISNVSECLDKIILNFNKQMQLYKNINKVEIRDKEFEKTTTKKIRRVY